MPEQIMFV